MFIYEHNKNGRLVELHIESWIPGMFFKNGKMFKLKDDPRKLEIEEPKITLSAPFKESSALEKTKEQIKPNKGIKSVSRKKINTQIKKSKAKKRHRCKKNTSFSREEIVKSLQSGALQRITVKDGKKYLWIQRPKVKKQLRGFCFFDVGTEFSMILHIEGSGKLYAWITPGVTYNTKEETADLVIEFKERKDKKES